MSHWREILLSVFLTLCVVTCEDNNGNVEPSPDLKNKFKSIPTTVKTFANDTVLLPCYLENAGSTYHVRWLKDKVLVADSSNHEWLPPERFRMHQNHSLQVSRLIPNDTGEYVCEVIRPQPWSPIRQVHAIEVLHPPEVTPLPELGLVHARIGDEVNIGCRPTGTPHPVVTWIFNDTPMELVVNRESLRFNVTSRHLSGVYECVAQNGVGEPARAQIKLVVDHAPIVWSDATWVHTALGIDTTLVCQVTASPSAKVHWFHGYNPVHLSSRIVAHTRHDRHTLRIKRLHDKDLGMYTCKAENRLGMAEIKIQVSGVGNIAVFKTDKNSATQTTYTLIWEVDSYSPIIEYTLWIRPYKQRPTPKEGVAVISDDDLWKKIIIPGENSDGPVHTASYVLKGLTPSTAYEAQVISRNKFGWSKPSSIYHFFTADRANSRSTIYGSVLPPTPEMEVVQNQDEILASNQTVLFATTGLIVPMKTSSSSIPQTQNVGYRHYSLVTATLCLLLLWIFLSLVN